MKPKITKVVSLPVAVIYREDSLSWEVATDDEGANPRFVGTIPAPPLVEWKKGIMLPANPSVPRSFDGYAIREEFMNLRTENECANFLNKYGRFSNNKSIDEAIGWKFETLMKLQRVFTGLAVRPLKDWSNYANSLVFPQADGANILAVLSALSKCQNSIEFRAIRMSSVTLKDAKYAAVVQAGDVISAVIATIQIDHVRESKFGACARPDCPCFYEIKSGHKRKYCSYDCAHVMAVRSQRQRENSKERGE